MSKEAERRAYKRIPFTDNIVINNVIMVKGIDISEGGLYVHTGRSFSPGKIVDVTIPLEGKELTIKAEIQHNQPAIGMGLKFIELSDEQKDALKGFIEKMTAMGVQVSPEKKRILLAEDDEMMRRMTKSKLMLEGFSIVDVADGVEVIKFLEKETPDLIILDIFMEKMDGLKVLTVLKESPQWKDIPVIVFSAKGSKDLMEKAIGAGADEFLAKMMTSPAKLTQSVKNILSRRIG